ncbi:MAG: hypothetical protein R2788_06095 [Saprospiraceae bacterium]
MLLRLFSIRSTDVSQAQTDVEAFAVLEPIADGFRNYMQPKIHYFPSGRRNVGGQSAALAMLTVIFRNGRCSLVACGT